MLDFRLADLYDTMDAASTAATDFYVVDGDLHVTLAGTSLADLAPASATAALPNDVTSALAVAMHDHSFEREPVARFATATGRQLRAARLPSAGRPYYAVMVRAGRRP